MRNISKYFFLSYSQRLQNILISPSILKGPKTVIIIELTVPMEENLSNANSRKKCNYQDLVAEYDNTGWCAHYFPCEIGRRCIYNTLLTKCIAALGVPSGKRRM